MKLQYLTDIGEHQNNFFYQNENQALNRVVVIYRTARQGNIANQTAINLRDCFLTILQNLNEIPNAIIGYNDYARNQIRNVAEIISQNNNLKYGMAQKFFNLFMKDLWAWDQLTLEQESVLHFPLDRIILSYIRNNPWQAWTRVYTTPEDYNNTFQEYLGIQEIFRNQLQYFNFNSPLELEQYLWHRFQ
ncbi:MAG: hypothetical protein C0412_16180 [Flavobacterium sp.]|nr:hypothetical protein [Flavobacterium sp.]